MGKRWTRQGWDVRLGLVIALLLAGACAHRPVAEKQPSPRGAVLAPAHWRDLGRLQDDREFDGLAGAVEGSLAYYGRLAPDSRLHFDDRSVAVRDYAAGLRGLLAILQDGALSASAKLDGIRARFDLLQSVGSDGKGGVLFTGYYEPELEGSLTPDPRFRYPLYRRPTDLLTIDLSQFPLAVSDRTIVGRVEGDRVVPYFSRGDIDGKGVLDGKGLELLWLDDPVAIFFLQIEGSGVVRLQNGDQVHVQYDGKNGRPYVSLGRLMIERGLLPKGQASMQAIRRYLADHPAQLRDLLDLNPSYTFFRIAKGGPFGNIGVALTPGRSIATDSRLFPKGALCLICTEEPELASDGHAKAWRPFTRFVCNQDTGGAITGPGRVDLFWGAGEKAEASAGLLQQPGSLYFLVPKG
ncbi:MAG: MltA domain-containing protein [Acidobacteriota bacterium]